MSYKVSLLSNETDLVRFIINLIIIQLYLLQKKFHWETTQDIPIPGKRVGSLQMTLPSVGTSRSVANSP